MAAPMQLWIYPPAHQRGPAPRVTPSSVFDLLHHTGCYAARTLVLLYRAPHLPRAGREMVAGGP